MVVAVKRFVVNNSLGGQGPPLPAGVGADQQYGGGIIGATSPTPLQPPVPQQPGPPLESPIPHVSPYNTAQCPTGYYRSGGICVPIELPTGIQRGAKGAIQMVQIDPQTTPGAMFLIRIRVTNIGTTAAKFAAKVTIPAIGITAQPTAGSSLEPGQAVVIHKQIQMPMTAPNGQLLPATIELIRTNADNSVVTDDTEAATVPSPGVTIPEAEPGLLPPVTS